MCDQVSILFVRQTEVQDPSKARGSTASLATNVEVVAQAMKIASNENRKLSDQVSILFVRQTAVQDPSKARGSTASLATTREVAEQSRNFTLNFVT